jgi:hypothetical protein
MRRLVCLGSVLLLLILGSSACTATGGAESTGEGEEVELASRMGDLQRWAHKATLALDARNPTLADFYLHELEETVEGIREEVPTYEGHPVADLTDQILKPRLEALEASLDERAWATVDRRVKELSRACNRCHAQTDHEFVRVDLEDAPNPYAQNFAPSE